MENDLYPLQPSTFNGFPVKIPNKSQHYIEKNYGKDCILKPIRKLDYSPNYLQTGTQGDLPDLNYWNKITKIATYH